MDQDANYFRALRAARRLIACARRRRDAPEHVLLCSFVYTILEAMEGDGQQGRDAAVAPPDAAVASGQ